MPRMLKLLGACVAVLLIAGAGIVFTDNTFTVILAVLKPYHDFDLSKKGAAPNYAEPSSWAAFPSVDDPADLVPDGEASVSNALDVDVFFIHPTGYLRGADWNWTIDLDSGTNENIQWMLANQASTFSSCCSVYAPRYRQASIFAYLIGYDTEIAQQSLDFAYNDVARAFEYFLEHRQPGRPFIIAGHSQGTHHATTLLKKRIAGTPLRNQLVAAYLIGGWIKHRDLVEMDNISACEGPTDLHCVNHWVSWGEGGSPNDFELIQGDKTICTNPLTWELDGKLADASHSKGAMASIGTYNSGIFGEDQPNGQAFEPLGAPMPEYTWAECRDGALFVEEQSSGRLGKSIIMPGINNYHGYDYQLFHMDIRENAMERSTAWLAAERLTQ